VHDRLPCLGSTLLRACGDFGANVLDDLGDLITQGRQVRVRALDAVERSIASGHGGVFDANVCDRASRGDFPARRRDSPANNVMGGDARVTMEDARKIEVILHPNGGGGFAREIHCFGRVIARYFPAPR
jgi:hypothetical protein